MRGALLLVPAIALSASCAQLLGIEDPVGDACSPFDVSTCAVTDTCDVDPATHLFACRAEGGLGVDERCDGGGLCAGALTCQAGLCRTLCDSQHGCDTGAGESSCLFDLSATATACDSACSILDGLGCPAGDQQCVADDTTNLILLCVPEGYFGNKPLGDHCDFLDECARGAGCDVNGSHTCVPYCDVENPGACGFCEELGRVHETLDLGLCTG
jgi:hypothetical protein